MSEQNVEIVRRFLAAEMDEALALADPGIVWNPIEESPEQGHDAVRASAVRWKSEWDDYELVPEDFADMGSLTASPSTAWTSGQHIVLGDGSVAHWDGTAWVTGSAP